MSTGNFNAVMSHNIKTFQKNPGISVPLLLVYQIQEIQETNRKNCHQKLHTTVTESEGRISF